MRCVPPHRDRSATKMDHAEREDEERQHDQENRESEDAWSVHKDEVTTFPYGEPKSQHNWEEEDRDLPQPGDRAPSSASTGHVAHAHLLAAEQDVRVVGEAQRDSA